MATTVLAEITPEQQQFLSSVAHLVWWEPAEQALQRPDYLVRQVMRYGTLEQSAAIEKLFPRATLQNILLGAEAGQLNHRSWNFWYARLFDCPRYEDIAPFPTRGNHVVKLSFFGNIDFGCIGPCEQTNDGVLSVASLDDLMATKLVALVQRVEAKDYLDVAALLDAGQNLEKGLCAVATLFGNAVPPIEIARTLTYFEGGDLPTLPATIKNTLLAATRVLRFEAIQPQPVIARELDATS